MKSRLTRLIAPLVLLLCSAGTLPLLGQTTTGQITGTVTDSTGAIVAGATVQVTNTETQATRTVTTSGSGSYSLTFLPPGTYKVSTSHAGFQTVTQSSIQLNVNQTITLDAALAVGTNETIVNVSTGAELLQAATSELGTVIGEQAVRELPLNGRNFTQLLTLTPGATPVSTSQGANLGTDDGSVVGIPGSSFSNPSINGQQNRETLYLLDGVVNTDFRTTTYTVLPIIDGVSQFKVQSHNDDPAFGSVLGGVVNLVTKSGTNSYHGSAWEFIRNDAFNARNPFTDITSTGGARKPAAFRQNQFGGTFGGPIVIPHLYNGKDKSFVFFAYEGWRYSRSSNSFQFVPTAAELSGDFSNSILPNPIYDPATTTATANGFTRTQFAGNKIPTNRINPQMQAYINTYFDKPNVALTTQGNSQINPKNVNNSNNYQGRVDQKLTKRDDAFFRWSNMFVNVLAPVTNSTLQSTSFDGLNIGLGITHVFSPKLVLNVNGGRASRGFTFFNTPNAGTAPLSQQGFLGLDTYGPVAVNLSSPYGGSGLGSVALRRNSAWSVGSQLSWQLGRHTLSIGETYIDQYRSQRGSSQNFNFQNQQTADPTRPGTTGNSLASALLGLPQQAGFQLNNVIRYSIPTWAVFAGDTWKATPRLTLNVGLRYDRVNQPNLTDGMNNGFNFDTGNFEIGGGVLPSSCATSGKAPCIPGSSTDAAANLANIIGNDGSVAGSHIVVAARATRAPDSANMNFGPRAGFAYRADDNTVVRGGYGIVYDTLNALSQNFSNSINDWPAKGSVSPQYNAIGAAPTTVAQAQANVGAPITTGSPFTNFNYYSSPKNKPLYSQQWNLEVERTVQKNMVLSIGYVGSISRRLAYSGVANAARTPSAVATTASINARKPFPYETTFVYDTNTASGNYNSLQSKLERRFSNGLQFLVSYTYSKSMDVGTSGHYGAENGPGGGSAIQDYYNPASNYSVSSYDVPHFMSISGLYELPFGKGKAYLNSGPVAYILGNWQFNTVAQLRSGQPYTVQVSGDVAGIGNPSTYMRPNLVGNPTPAMRTKARWFDPTAFAVPTNGTFGNVGRNSLRSSGVYTDDVSLFKTFPIREIASVQFRAEAFNVFNNINYGPPSDTNISNTATAGIVRGMVGNPRQLQFALKVSF